MSLQKITLTLKNKEVLKKYISKYQSINTELLLKMKPTCFYSVNFTEKREYIKYSTLDYKDVFEEAEIPLETQIHVPIKDIKTFVQYLSSINEPNVKIEIHFEEVDDKKLLSLLGIDTPILVATSFNINGKRLKLKIKMKDIAAYTSNFKLTEDRVNGFVIEDETKTKFKFIANKEDIATINKMIGLENSTNVENTHINIENGDKSTTITGQNFALTLTKKDTILDEKTNLSLRMKFLNYIDVEDSEISISETDSGINFFRIKSTESDTCSIIADSTKH